MLRTLYTVLGVRALLAGCKPLELVRGKRHAAPRVQPCASEKSRPKPFHRPLSTATHDFVANCGHLKARWPGDWVNGVRRTSPQRDCDTAAVGLGHAWMEWSCHYPLVCESSDNDGGRVYSIPVTLTPYPQQPLGVGSILPRRTIFQVQHP